jgi:hypothetical protein
VYLRTRGCLGGCPGADVRAALFRGASRVDLAIFSRCSAVQSAAPSQGSSSGRSFAGPSTPTSHLRATPVESRCIQELSRIPIGFQGLLKVVPGLARRLSQGAQSRLQPHGQVPRLRVHRSEHVRKGPDGDANLSHPVRSRDLPRVLKGCLFTRARSSTEAEPVSRAVSTTRLDERAAQGSPKTPRIRVARCQPPKSLLPSVPPIPCTFVNTTTFSLLVESTEWMPKLPLVGPWRGR